MCNHDNRPLHRGDVGLIRLVVYLIVSVRMAAAFVSFQEFVTIKFRLEKNSCYFFCAHRSSLCGLSHPTPHPSFPFEACVHTQSLYVLGVMDYLSAEISTSKQKKFSLVTFVDTPGLVDGDMIYPFNVNSAITWLGKSSQLPVPMDPR